MYNSGNSSKNVTGSAIVDGTVEAADLATAVNNDIADGVAGKATADLALPKVGGALTGAVTTNSTFDGRDVATDGAALDVLDLAINSAADAVAINILASEEVQFSNNVKLLNLVGATRWINTDETNTGTGAIKMQAGSGSKAYGGSISLYAHAHATHPGDVAVGLSSGAGGSFRVVTDGTDSDTAATRFEVENISGDVTVETGNLVIGTSGKGIDFSATSDGSGTMTSEVLDDYEEGTFTATWTGTTETTVGSYTKVGRTVSFTVYGLTLNVTTAVNAVMSGLPFDGGGSPQAVSYTHGTWCQNSGGGAYLTNTSVAMIAVNATSTAPTVIGGSQYATLSGTYQVL
jgi:hypothetical protein